MTALIVLLIRGGVAHAKYIGVRVGKNCRIYTTDFGTEPFLVTIGDNVTITSKVRFITHDGSTWLMRDKRGRRYRFAPVSVGNNVFIGTGTVILPGIKIEDNVIIGAGSVVTKSVPQGTVVAGVPAKIINSFDNVKQRMLKENISDSDFIRKETYRQWVNDIVSAEYKPFLSPDFSDRITKEKKKLDNE